MTIEPVRTRFAPSPTGHLHIGGARTALYSWLFAKKHKGSFVLRIEDTDQARSTPQSVQAIVDSMHWLGLDYDEGPIYQTQRLARYQEVISQLVSEGKAYRCYCSVERLTQLRDLQLKNKQKPRYDGHCRDVAHVAKDQPYVIRFRSPQTGFVRFEDRVYGAIQVANAELDDLIIARSDGTPTYNLTVVVDDWDMRITHVIRGDDHINNTPRQIHILAALGAQIPVYAHVPMILGTDGKRLSKRTGCTGVLQYRADGFLPEALLNYLVRLGWSCGDRELFAYQDMIAHFDLSAISRSPAAVNQGKLLWLNQHYLKTGDPGHIASELMRQFKRLHVSTQKGPNIKAVIKAQAARVKTLAELAEKSVFFYVSSVQYDARAAQKHLTQAVLPILSHLCAQLETMVWEVEALHTLVKSTAEKYQLKLGKVAQPLRVALTGGTISPPIDITLYLLGRQKTLQRLAAACARIQAASV